VVDADAAQRLTEALSVRGFHAASVRLT